MYPHKCKETDQGLQDLHSIPAGAVFPSVKYFQTIFPAADVKKIGWNHNFYERTKTSLNSVIVSEKAWNRQPSKMRKGMRTEGMERMKFRYLWQFRISYKWIHRNFRPFTTLARLFYFIEFTLQGSASEKLAQALLYNILVYGFLLPGLWPHRISILPHLEKNFNEFFTSKQNFSFRQFFLIYSFNRENLHRKSYAIFIYKKTRKLRLSQESLSSFQVGPLCIFNN